MKQNTTGNRESSLFFMIPVNYSLENLTFVNQSPDNLTPVNYSQDNPTPVNYSPDNLLYRQQNLTTVNEWNHREY